MLKAGLDVGAIQRVIPTCVGNAVLSKAFGGC